MKVALAFCPKWQHDYPVVSLALLSAQLKKNGHEAEVFDINRAVMTLNELGGTPQRSRVWEDKVMHTVAEGIFSSYGGWLKTLARKIISNGCRLVGFSIYYSNLHMSLEFAKILKELNPEIKIVFGGPDCLIFHNCLAHIRREAVDAVVFGEGDISFPRLVDGFAATGRLQAGPGILLKDDESTWKEAQEIVENLNDLPYADYSGFDALQTYSGGMIHTTRGCVRKCVFCKDWREMSFRRMSGRRIFDELAHLVSRYPHMKSFLFGDSLCNSSMPELLEFCSLVHAHGIDTMWESYAIVRPDMTPQALQTIRLSGCNLLRYGVESGSDRLLRDMNKGVPVALNAEVLRRTVEAGIMTGVTWMVGFPTETEEAFEESLNFIRTNAKNISSLGCSIFTLIEQESMSKRFGLEPGQHEIFWSTIDGKNTLPARLQRMRRTLETAFEAGVPAGCLGIKSLPEWDAYEQQAMSEYESHLALAGR